MAFDWFRCRIFVIPLPGMTDGEALDVAHTLVGHEEWAHGPPPTVLGPGADLLDCLVGAGCFPSKGQARKNFKKNTTLEEGLTEIRVGRAMVWVIRCRVLPRSAQVRLAMQDLCQKIRGFLKIGT